MSQRAPTPAGVGDATKKNPDRDNGERQDVDLMSSRSRTLRSEGRVAIIER